MKQPLSTAQLAETLGLTRVTVSRAINNDPRVAEKTRRRVQKAMEENLIKPNAMARALATGRSDTIGLALGGDLQGNYAHELLKGIELTLKQKDLSILIGVGQFDPKRERNELSTMLSRRVEGILAQPLPENQSSYERLQKTGTPFVFLADYIKLKGASWVVSDVKHDAELAINHLLDLGHRHIGYVGPKSLSPQITPRLRIFCDTLKKNGLPLHESHCIEDKLGVIENIKADVHQIMQQPNRPTALFCAVDILAIHVMDQLRHDGFSVPKDVSVIGIGDTEMGHHCAPALTTISEDRIAIGQNATKILLDIIDGKIKRPKQVFLPGELIIRNSTCPPKS